MVALPEVLTGVRWHGFFETAAAMRACYCGIGDYAWHIENWDKDKVSLFKVQDIILALTAKISYETNMAAYG